jgi:hypothetical protein
MKLGFDLDRVLISYPPFIPGDIIDWIYKRHNKGLSYRFPGKIEQKIRIFFHLPFFRKPIKENLEAIKKNWFPREEFYLISGRFSFLRKRTEQILKLYEIDKFFKERYFNFQDEQPHIFKYRIIKNLKLDKYVDDDLDLLNFLAKKHLQTKLYWLNSKGSPKRGKIPKEITPIKNLFEFFK